MAKKLDEHHFISLGLFITVASAVATGGFAWGQMDTRVKKLEEAQPQLKEQQKQLHEIDKKQGILIIQQKQSEEHQKEFQTETKDALKEILRKLDER